MAYSNLHFIKRYAEFQPRSKINDIPPRTRGFYTLLKKAGRKPEYSVIYVGMARGLKAGIRGRLRGHAKSKSKSKEWTHFSVYEVHDNITATEIEELEGLFRHIYRRDVATNRLNRQRRFKRLMQAKQNRLKKWGGTAG